MSASSDKPFDWRLVAFIVFLLSLFMVAGIALYVLTDKTDARATTTYPAPP